MQSATFGVWDYLVFGLMLVASLCIGIYHAVRGKNQTTSEYLVAGGSMTFLPVAFSLVATFTSSIMMLGTPAEGYLYGVSWILGEVGTEFGAILELLLVLVFLKRLNLLTPYEFLERRFQSRVLRVLATIISCISQLRYMGAVLYGTSVALKTVTGFSISTSVALTGGAAVIYTAIGGLKAVIWTDVLQFSIMVLGLLTTTIMGTVYAGGVSEVWSRAAASGRLHISADPDPTIRHTAWNLLFGRILAGFGFLIAPAALQRISSTKSLAHARRALIMVCPLFVLLCAVCLAEGVVAFAYFAKKGCDPLASKQIESPNQIIPFFIVDMFQNVPGMSGLFLAALASASLSTISSSLSAIANITWYDLFQPCFPRLSEFRSLLVAKATVIVFGIMGSLMAFVISFAGTKTLTQISYTFEAVTSNLLIGLFYLGALFSFVNTKGAITGLLTGLGIMTWLTIGSLLTPGGGNSLYASLGPTDQCPVNMSRFTENSPTVLTTSTIYNNTDTPDMETTTSKSGLEWFYGLSYTLFINISVGVVIITGTAASLLTGGLKSRADPELVIHVDDVLCWRSRGRRHRRHDNNAVLEPCGHTLM